MNKQKSKMMRRANARRANAPVPTITAVGVARPSAQGHEMTTTDVAASMAYLGKASTTH